MSTTKVSIRFLILSDTHNFTFARPKEFIPFKFPTPKVDVVLHCGDITEIGGANSYRKFVTMIGNIDAELKLVIAGNHDLDLDEEYVKRNFVEGEDDPEEHNEAMEVMTGPLAKTAGVTYLNEGTHTFTLSNGATFKIYVSPYQPVFCDWAFPYERHEDRFNLPHQAAPNTKSIATKPVPDFGPDGVDIMMTHGPPKSILDRCPNGNVGCENLLRAASRARPHLYCFGHIHEGHGAEVVRWKDDKSIVGGEAIESQGEMQVNAYPEVSWDRPVVRGKETLMINASIMDQNNIATNAPWVVDLRLPGAG